MRKIAAFILVVKPLKDFIHAVHNLSFSAHIAPRSWNAKRTFTRNNLQTKYTVRRAFVERRTWEVGLQHFVCRFLCKSSRYFLIQIISITREGL